MKQKELKKKTHSFAEFIRIGWKLLGAGTPFTTWQLDKPMGFIWGWPVVAIDGCGWTGYPIGKLLTALKGMELNNNDTNNLLCYLHLNVFNYNSKPR